MGDAISYQIIHSFDAHVDGYLPTAFTIKGDGTVFGISYCSLECDGQSVFQLMEKDGIWTNNLIYTPPMVSLKSILIGADKTLVLCSKRGNAGYVIQLSSPPSSGQWAENDLYRLERHLEGCTSLTVDPPHGFLGTSALGGEFGAGTLFSLTSSPLEKTAYAFHNLHRFSDMGEQSAGALLRLGGLYYGATTYSSHSGGEVVDVRP